jgi:hypothetical protein
VDSKQRGRTLSCHGQLLQLRVLGLGLLRDGDVGVGIFPEREESLVGSVRAVGVIWERLEILEEPNVFIGSLLEISQVPTIRGRIRASEPHSHSIEQYVSISI